MAKKTTGVFKRGRIWWVGFSVDGIQYKETARTTRKEEAVALLAKRKTEVFAGRFFPEKKRSDLNMNGLRTLWMEHAEGKKSIKDDKQRFGTIVEHFGAMTRIASLRPADIDRFRNTLAKRIVRSGKPMQPSTINRHTALLQWALNFATANGYHHHLPPGCIKPLQENNERDRICTKDEYDRLCAAATPQLRLAIIIGYHTAMRLDEVVSLTWNQIDLTERMIRLRADDTKTSTARTVPLAAPVVEALKAWPRRIDGRVFRAVSNTVSSDFSELCKKVGIENLHYHDLRHTALTNFRRNRMDLVTIKKISGHKTWKMVERYQVVDDNDLRLAMAQIDEREGKRG